MLEVPGSSLQVILTLHGSRVTIQSTAPPGPDGWALIRSVCVEGLLAAHAQFLVEQQRAASVLVMPSADMRLVPGR
jgi:hypothetical protein